MIENRQNLIFEIEDLEHNEKIKSPKFISESSEPIEEQEIKNLTKRKRGKLEEELASNDYINKISSQVKFDDNFLTQTKLLLNPHDIMTKSKNIKLEITTEEETAPITKKLKTMPNSKVKQH